MTKLNEKITIIGFRNVKIENINTFLETFRIENKNVQIQFFNAKYIASSEHLFFAALNALNSFDKKTNISNNLAVESLLYASAQRQITKAVKMLGIKQDSLEVAVLILTESISQKNEFLKLISNIISGERDDSVLDLTDEKFRNIKQLFEISDLELEAKLQKEGQEKQALIDLVIEHMALLGTKS
jgi:KEOPS complex subunit Cgi121